MSDSALYVKQTGAAGTDPGLDMELISGVLRERVQVGGSALAEIARVLATAANGGEFALAMRNADVGDMQVLDTASLTTAVRDLLAADNAFRNDLDALWFENTSTLGTEIVIYRDNGTTEAGRFYCPPKDTVGIGRRLKGEPPVGGVGKKWKWKTASSVNAVTASGIVLKTAP